MTTKEVLSTLPKVVRNFTLFTSVAILVGACCLFHAYITECVLSLYGSSVSHTKHRVVVAVATGGLVWLVSIPRSLKILFVASSYGIVIIGFCSVFIIVKSALQFDTHSCTEKLVEAYGVGFGGFGPVAALLSTLTLSFYTHSFILPLVAQSTRASKIPRNVFIAYICAGFSYAAPSAISVVAFKTCHEFSSDFVEMFDDPFADAARCAIILLVMIVYPIIVFISRTQIVEMFSDKPDISYPMHLGLNFLIIAGITVVPVFNVNPTVIAAMAGVFGTYWSLILPCGSFLKMRRAAGTATTGLYVAHGLIMLLAVALMVITILTVVGLIPQASALPATVTLPPTPAPTNHTPIPTNHTHSLFP